MRTPASTPRSRTPSRRVLDSASSTVVNHVSSWRTPDGAVASPDYLYAICQAVIEWWCVHQRRDLPWRLSAQARQRISLRTSLSSPPSCAALVSETSATPAADGATGLKLNRPGLHCLHALPSCSCYDAYEVWVSEVMSQQTQLTTVIAYFTRWMARFATISALAQASEEEVRAMWSGLGYYRRAMYLHRGAQAIQGGTWRQSCGTPALIAHGQGRRDTEYREEDCTGAGLASPPAPAPDTSALSLPRSAQQWMSIPGIGSYTAAAVASICFGEPVLAVDGNVVRVMSRLRAEREFDPKSPTNLKRVRLWGQELMAQLRVGCGDGAESVNKSHAADDDEEEKETRLKAAGALNQALMELGASVCRPSGAPLCVQCPLRRFCRSFDAQQSGQLTVLEGVIPLRARPTPRRHERVLCVVHELFTMPAGTLDSRDGGGRRVRGEPARDLQAGKQTRIRCTGGRGAVSRLWCRAAQQDTTKCRGVDDTAAARVVDAHGTTTTSLLPLCGMHVGDAGATHRVVSCKERSSSFVVLRRPREGLLGGMLEFPSVALPHTRAYDACEEEQKQDERTNNNSTSDEQRRPQEDDKEAEEEEEDETGPKGRTRRRADVPPAASSHCAVTARRGMTTVHPTCVTPVRPTRRCCHDWRAGHD